jgi:phosphate acyltransferase
MIAVDAMGGDFAPKITIQGAYNAACKKVEVVLYGQEKIMAEILKKIDPEWHRLPLRLVDCPEVVEMSEEPTRSVLKKNSSLMRALQAVKNQQAHAVVTAGNSGAAVVGSILIFERVKGIARPALGTFLPTKKGSVFLVDIGANVDCKPEYLQQFAYMGHLFVQHHKKIKDPRIKLLSNGHERGKGAHATKQAYYLLEQSSINFVGNIESRDIFDDCADVIVCDGFVGNILLKGIQGTSAALNEWIKKSFSSSLYAKVVGLLTRPFFKKIKKSIDYRQTGGALLLGVNYPLIIAHGCSNAHAFENAILFAHQIVQSKITQQFNENLLKLLDRESAIKKSLNVSPHDILVC